ncbi:2-deoxy-D-gluconate 3-dehydrogenase [Phlyctema vagabunda]|uniref:2-deoxy-D-gluconate 3-dehydrogenase n=1 Tax=Phlyctema vagabunda TaxID=108571 RepID=A0ABR4PQI7_9HELO
MELFSLKGKTALITGGGRGIGQAIAVGLAEAGADVILILRDLKNEGTKRQIEALGRKCDTYQFDLSDREAAQEVASTVTKEHKIDILVNVAGIQRRHAAADFPLEVFDEILQVNLRSTFVICRDIGKYWLENRIQGRIINTASMATFQGGINMAAYTSSKGAVGQLTKALSNEWSPHGIRVNAIAPGYIATDMNIDTRTSSDKTYLKSITDRIPAGRWGEPSEFKGPAIFLASEASSYINGEIMIVDGGWMAR